MTTKPKGFQHPTKMTDEQVLEFCERPRYVKELEKKFGAHNSTVFTRLDELVLDGKMRRFRTGRCEMWQYHATSEGNPNTIDTSDPFYMVIALQRERARCEARQKAAEPEVTTPVASHGNAGTGLSKPPKSAPESNAGETV